MFLDIWLYLVNCTIDFPEYSDEIVIHDGVHPFSDVAYKLNVEMNGRFNIDIANHIYDYWRTLYVARNKTIADSNTRLYILYLEWMVRGSLEVK